MKNFKSVFFIVTLQVNVTKPTFTHYLDYFSLVFMAPYLMQHSVIYAFSEQVKYCLF